MAKAADCGREGRMALAELVARTRTVRRFREEAPLAPADIAYYQYFSSVNQQNNVYLELRRKGSWN